MTNFNGITPKAIELLSENRFNDSKAFYEEHKEELKQLATIPMRQIVLDLAEMMTELDDKMYTDPVYTCFSHSQRHPSLQKQDDVSGEPVADAAATQEAVSMRAVLLVRVFAGVLHHGSGFLCAKARPV